MADQRSNSINQVKPTGDVDQAIITLKGLLTQPKEYVLVEMMTNCYALRNSPGFPKLVEVFLIYMDRIKDLPMLETQTVDQILNLLFTVCEKKITAQPARALSILARLFVNPEDAPGNRIVRERFNYTRDFPKRIGLEEYLTSAIESTGALDFSVFLMEAYREAQPSHISQDLERRGMVNQAEKRSLRNQIKVLAQKQVETSKVIAEINERNIMLATEIERLRLVSDGSPIRPSSKQRVGSLPSRKFLTGTGPDKEGRVGNDEKLKNLAFGQFMEQGMRELMERHDTLSDRLTELDKKFAKGIEMIKENYMDKESFRKDKDGISRPYFPVNKDVVEKELDMIRDDFLGYKRDIDHRVEEYTTHKRDLDIKLSEFASYKKSLENKIANFDNYKAQIDLKLDDFFKKNPIDENGRLLSISLPVDSSFAQKDLKALKEKVKLLEQRIADSKPVSLPSIQTSYQSPYAELNNRELGLIKNQIETLLIALQKTSRELSDHVFSQTSINDELKKKTRFLEDETNNVNRKLYETRDIVNNLIKDFNQFKLTVNNFVKSPHDDSTNDISIDTKLSKIDEICRGLVEKQVQGGLLTLEKKLFTDIKKELDFKLAEQVKLNEILRSNVENQIKVYETNLTRLQEKVEKPSISSGQADSSEREEEKRRLKVVWNALASISTYLGIKINASTGGLEKENTQGSKRTG